MISGFKVPTKYTKQTSFSSNFRLCLFNVMFRKKCLLFTRKRISFFVMPSLCISLIFIIYQITIFLQISNEYKLKQKPNLIRGVHEEQETFYRPNSENKFTCISSLEMIDFKHVNDNYCDCLDGSDEPGTNACPNGLFFCASHQVAADHFRKTVPSSKVNDGICDCCDGSDEWGHNHILDLDRALQEKARRFHVPCPKMC